MQKMSEISSIITPDFTIPFLRLPMGAKNSPALFCAVIGHVFRDFILTRLPESAREEMRFLFIYMDDLLCYSNSFDDRLAHLGHFAAEIVELLGFLVGRHGIKVNPKKLVAVQKLVWSEACQEAFETLKRALTTAPILA
jgi:hypothetical protein